MSTTAMTGQLAEASPRFKSRLAGVFEALEGITSAFGQVFILGRLVVFSDAAATAANILGHQRLFWVGFVSSVLGVAFHITWTLLFYNLFTPANRSLSLLAAFVGLVVCALQALTAFLYVTAATRLTRGELFGRLHNPTVAGASAHLSQIECLRLRHRPSVLRIVVRSDRLPHFQVDLPASNSRHPPGNRWFWLDDVRGTTVRRTHISAHRCRVPGSRKFPFSYGFSRSV